MTDDRSVLYYYLFIDLGNSDTFVRKYNNSYCI